MFKEKLIAKIIDSIKGNPSINILELGSGTSTAIAPLVKKNNNINYHGIEPNIKSHKTAVSNIGWLKNVKLTNSLAYDLGGSATYDLCFSLSVLEHVKDLQNFLTQSTKLVKSGGLVVHSYDLGHSLHSGSLKESFQVFLGNYLPWSLSESKYVRYVDIKKVIDHLEKNGVDVYRITYHQMPDHKSLLKSLKSIDKQCMKLTSDIVEWEFEISPFLNELDRTLRERLFPTICIWGRKR